MWTTLLLQGPSLLPLFAGTQANSGSKIIGHWWFYKNQSKAKWKCIFVMWTEAEKQARTPLVTASYWYVVPSLVFTNSKTKSQTPHTHTQFKTVTQNGMLVHDICKDFQYYSAHFSLCRILRQSINHPRVCWVTSGGAEAVFLRSRSAMTSSGDVHRFLEYVCLDDVFLTLFGICWVCMFAPSIVWSRALPHNWKFNAKAHVANTTQHKCKTQQLL